MKAHDVTASGERLDLLPPSRRPIIVQGICTSSRPDHHRTVLCKYALGAVVSHVPLLIHHDWSRVAGRIRRFAWKPEGLWIEALIEAEEGRRLPAFSIAAQVLEYSIEEKETERFWARVTKAKLREVSLTDFPANDDCRITRRFEAPASNEMFDAMIGRVSHASKIAGYLVQANKQKDCCDAYR